MGVCSVCPVAPHNQNARCPVGLPRETATQPPPYAQNNARPRHMPVEGQVQAKPPTPQRAETAPSHGVPATTTANKATVNAP